MDLEHLYDSFKEKVHDFLERISIEKEETKEAFNILVDSVQNGKELTDEEKREIGGNDLLYNEHIFKIEMGKNKWYVSGLKEINPGYITHALSMLIENSKSKK